MSRLPLNWKLTCFKDLFARLQYGLTAKATTESAGPHFLRITDIQDGDINWSSVPTCTGIQDIDIERYLLAPGDFVFARSGSVEKAARIKKPPENAVFASYLIRGTLRDPRYSDWLAWFIRSPQYLEQIREASAGIGLSNVNAQKLSAVQVPLPPPDDQARITAKLDSLFARSKSAREELARIPRLVERYKRAILAAAFRGELTAEWRAAHVNVQPVPLVDERAAPAKRKREGGISGPISLQQSQLPETWKSVTVDSVGKVILGRQRSPKNHTGPYMRPYVRAANITWDGWDLTDVKEMNFDETDFNKFKLHPGDVLINEGSGSADEVGKPAIWNGEIPNCCFQNTLIAVRPHAMTSDYLYFVFLNAALSRSFVDETRGVNIHHIGRAGLAQFVIPLPVLEEQQEIVRRVTTALKRIDKICTETSRATELLNRLDQATLAKAFRGELLLQQEDIAPSGLPHCEQTGNSANQF